MGENHTGVISKKDFDWLQWTIYAGNSAHQFVRMWTTEYEHLLEYLHSENFMVLKYESLLHDETRFVFSGVIVHY